MRFFCSSIFLLLAIWHSAEASDTAYWQFCGNCYSDAQYVSQAYDAPQPHSIIYVSNQATLSTLKYERFTVREDFGDGYVWMTHIVPIPLSPSEESAFREALSLSTTIYANIDRGDLTGLSAAIGPADSVVMDIRRGFLGSSFLNALNFRLASGGFLPTVESVSAEAGLETPIVGANIGDGLSLRVLPLLVVIVYPDGSKIEVTREADGRYVRLVAIDVEGNAIEFDESGLLPINQNSIGDGYSFGPGPSDIGDAGRELIERFNSSVLRCTFEDLPNGRVRLNCVRR